MLEALIASKRALLEKEEEQEKQEELSKEILELTKQLGKVEAEVEAEEKAAEKERADAKAKTKMAVNFPPQNGEDEDEGERPGIKVVARGAYKGFNLKREVRMLQFGNYLSDRSQERARKDPEGAELVSKMFIDLLGRACVRSRGLLSNSWITKAAMQEDTAGEGGYLVAPEYKDALLGYIRDESLALQHCRVWPMGTDVAYVYTENAKVSVAITAEENTATESEPTISQVTLTAKRHDAYAISSNELLQDQNIGQGIVAILMSQFNEAIGQKIDSCVFLGTGDPVSGVFLSTGYSEVFSSGSTHFSELLESNIRNVIADIRPNRRRNAKFFMANSVLWPYVYGLQDSQNRPLFVDTRSGGPAPYRLWGYPIVEGNDDIMKSTSASGTGMIVFGDLAGFFIGERLATVDMIVDPYTEMADYQTRFGFFTRWAYAHGLNQYYSRIVTAGR
jgi:HK97 family phage major capsid protein